MVVFAYCAASFEQATWEAAGVKPLLAPPVRRESFEPRWMEGARFLYFDLHGLPGGATHWMGDCGTIALDAAQVRQADLEGAVVFSLACWLGDEVSPMREAFLAAGARAVMGGSGPNLSPPAGASYGGALLGRWVRLMMEWGAAPELALNVAKARVMATRKGRAKTDTLGFRIFGRNNG